jgi:hypothetical protein
MFVDQLAAAYRADRSHTFFEPPKFAVEGMRVVARMRAFEANHEAPALSGQHIGDGIGWSVALIRPPGGLPCDLNAGRDLTRSDRLAGFELKAESLTVGKANREVVDDAAHGQIDTLECRRQPLAESIGRPKPSR